MDADLRVYHLRQVLSLVSNQDFQRDLVKCSEILSWFLHYPIVLYLVAPALSESVRREVANFIIFQRPRFYQAIKEAEKLANLPFTDNELERHYQRLLKLANNEEWVVLTPFDKSPLIPPDLLSN